MAVRDPRWLARSRHRSPSRLADYPDIAIAHNNLEFALAKDRGHYRKQSLSTRRRCGSTSILAEVNKNLGVALSKIPEKLPEAITHLEAALRIRLDPETGNWWKDCEPLEMSRGEQPCS